MNLELSDEEILRLIGGDVYPEDILSMSRRIVRNAVKCSNCGETIESAHRHDFRWCGCHSVAVDGGHDYLRRLYTDGVAWEDLAEYEDLTEAELRARVDEELVDCEAGNPAEFRSEAIAEFRAALDEPAQQQGDDAEVPR